MTRLALVVMLATGCVAYDETLHVHVRDPAQVAVAVETPAGPRTLVEAGASARADVPPAAPPYHEDARGGAWVSREGSALVAHCDWCAYDDVRRVIRYGGEIDLPGGPGMLRRDGDLLHMRYDYIAPLPCRRHHGLCERPAFTLELELPRSNVDSIDYERKVSRDHGELIGAKIAMGFGSVFAAAKLGLVAWGIADSGGKARVALVSLGGAFTLGGGGFFAQGLSTLLADDSITPVRP